MIHHFIDIRNLSVRPHILALSLFLLVAGLIYTYFTSHATRAYYTQSIGFSSEVRKNPFLALSKFLQVQGIDVELKRDFSLLDDELSNNDVIMITNSRKPLSQKRIDHLMNFVSNGGHLVLNAIEEFDDERGKSGAPILDRLGVRLYQNEGITSSLFDSDDDTDSTKNEENKANYSVSIFFKGYEQNTNIEFNENQYLSDSLEQATYRVNDATLDHLLQFEKDNGIITVLSDIDFIKNYSIDQMDHAMFIYQLTQSSEKLWIIYNPTSPSILVLLWQYASFVLLSIFVFLVLLIWNRQIKTGPIFSLFDLNNRQLLQHIKASALFKWKFSTPTNMLTHLRQDILQLMVRRDRRFVTLEKNEQIVIIHQISGINKKQLQIHLFDDINDPFSFIECVKNLRRLRLLILRK